MHVLAGDIGGTKVLLRLAHVGAGSCRVVKEQRYESSAFSGLSPIVQEFLKSLHRDSAIDAACFGIAGPVTEVGPCQIAKVTNLPWEVDSAALAREFSLPAVRLINDFQAVGYGIETLTGEDLVTLQEGSAQPRAPRAVIGAGTGLGQGILVWQHDHYEAIATEGGHTDFAPTDGLQVGLWHYLRQQFEHISYERLVSGSGLVLIYSYLREQEAKYAPLHTDPRNAADPAAAISELVLSGADALAVQALDLFLCIYGAQAGNLALSAGATGGVYVAGGIAPKIIHKLTDGTFMRAFLKKGRMAPLLAAVPVQVVMNPNVGLMGATLAAATELTPA
ncbi:MAG: glucokinase [Hydrogenophilales bacterium]|nr:glucokinase [Hydrogenophilales bacterium]